MDKSKVYSVLKKVTERMLHIQKGDMQESCPIGIIDFDKWEWPQGVGLYGVYRLYKVTGDDIWLKYLREWYDARIAEGLPEKNVNTMAPMLTLSYVYEVTSNNMYLSLMTEWAEWVMEQMPRTREGGLQHIVSGEENPQQLWDDTLFMTVLFLARMGKILNRQDMCEEAEYQFLLHIQYLCAPGSGLWYHGWSFERMDHFANAFWARGNCWITAGIPEFLEISGVQGAVRRYFVSVLRRQVDSLVALQKESGLWTTLLDDSSSYEETSAAAGFAYGILRGIHMKLLDEKYFECAMRAVDGVMDQIRDDGTVEGVSYGTGMGRTLDHYREIPICPMAYGQSLTALMLCEAMA